MKRLLYIQLKECKHRGIRVNKDADVAFFMFLLILADEGNRKAHFSLHRDCRGISFFKY